MSTRECCRSCQHCVARQAATGSWCQLRKISFHGDIAAFAFCHHWTKRSPSLPILDEPDREYGLEKQLEFGRELSSIEI